MPDEAARPGLPLELLPALSGFVADKLGLHFPEKRWRDLDRGVSAAAREIGAESPEAFARRLLSASPGQDDLDALAIGLTVGETFFWRDKEQLDVLEQPILADLITKRLGADRRLRIWSAGCSTGEEPYSIAIQLKRVVPDLDDWQVTILATDVNRRALAKAKVGVYSEWSFRGVPAWLKKAWFVKTADGHWRIADEIKRMVTFSHLNLVADPYPSLVTNTTALDVIFCRNVLMYLPEKQTATVVRGFHRSLVNGGWLFVGPSETSIVREPPFVAARFPGAMVLSKVAGSPPREAAAATAAASPAQPPRTAPRTTATPASRAAVAAPPVWRTRKEDAQAAGSATPLAIRPSYDVATELYEQARFEAAAKVLVSFLAYGPPEPAECGRARTLLARVYANLGKLDEALAHCEQALAENKISPALYYLQATILGECGRHGEAVTSFQRALYLDQNFILAHFSVASALRREGRPSEAARHLRVAHDLLARQRPDEILPESDGLTAGRLAETVAAMIDMEVDY